MGKRVVVPLPIKGQYTAGDPASIPEDAIREGKNVLPYPNRWSVRPPFTYDNQLSVLGLAIWEDEASYQSRGVLTNSAGELREKSLGTEVWSPSLGSPAANRISSWCNYLGKLWVMQESSGVPASAFSWEGTNIDTSPFNSAIQARAIAVFNERLFLGYPRVTITPLTRGGLTATVYDWSSATYSATNINVRTIQQNTGVYVCRLAPTSGDDNACSIIGVPNADYLMIVGTSSTVPRTFTWRAEFRGVANALGGGLEPVAVRVPFTMEMVFRGMNRPVGARTYAVGCIILETASDGNLYIYRCAVGGLSAAVAPTFDPQIGSLTTDGAVSWVNESTDVIASYEGEVPSVGEKSDWSVFTITATVPPFTALPAATVSHSLSPRLKLYNTESPSAPANCALDVSFRDGLADDDPAKANHGQQYTAGDYIFPFINTETATTKTVDVQSIIWSEVRDPKRIRAVNTWDAWEEPGHVTALAVASGRIVAFKRSAFWVFQGSANPDIPIRREWVNRAVGCIGSLALDVYNDEIFFIAENDVYRWRPGDSEARSFAGDEMRETIMSRGANWVEVQTTYKRPLLCVDQHRKQVWVYTQKNTLYCFDLRTEKWTTHTLPNSKQLDAMVFNQTMLEMYFALGGSGLVRLDYSKNQQDECDAGGAIYAVDSQITFRPIELYNPPRFDATLEEIRFFHACSFSQTGQTTKAEYSFDQGNTYPKQETVTLASLAPDTSHFLPVRLDAYQTAPSITVRLTHSGKGGAPSWTISPRAYAYLNVRRGELIQTNQTVTSGGLS